MKTPRFLLILLAAVLLYACAPTPTTFAWPSASPGPTATEEGVISVGDEKVAAEDQPIEQEKEESGLTIEVKDELGNSYFLEVESGQAGEIPEGVESKPAYQAAVDRLMKLIARVTKSVNGKGPVASLTDLGAVFSDGYVNGQYVVNLDLTVKSIGSRHPGQSYPVGTGFCFPIVNGKATQYEPQKGTRGHYFQRDIEGQQIIEFDRDGKPVREIFPVVLDENGDVVQFETWVKASLSTEEQQFSDLDGIEFDGAYWEINGELDENARMEMTDFGAVLLNPDTNYIYAVIINGEAHKADFALMAGQELAEISIFKGKTLLEAVSILNAIVDEIPLKPGEITKGIYKDVAYIFDHVILLMFDGGTIQTRVNCGFNGERLFILDMGWLKNGGQEIENFRLNFIVPPLFDPNESGAIIKEAESGAIPSGQIGSLQIYHDTDGLDKRIIEKFNWLLGAQGIKGGHVRYQGALIWIDGYEPDFEWFKKHVLLGAIYRYKVNGLKLP